MSTKICREGETGVDFKGSNARCSFLEGYCGYCLRGCDDNEFLDTCKRVIRRLEITHTKTGKVHSSVKNKLDSLSARSLTEETKSERTVAAHRSWPASSLCCNFVAFEKNAPGVSSRAYAFGREMVCSQKSFRNINFFENAGHVSFSFCQTGSAETHTKPCKTSPRGTSIKRPVIYWDHAVSWGGGVWVSVSDIGRVVKKRGNDTTGCTQLILRHNRVLLFNQLE